MARTSKRRGKSNFKIKSPYPLVLGIGAGLMANKQMKRQKRKNTGPALYGAKKGGKIMYGYKAGGKV